MNPRMTWAWTTRTRTKIPSDRFQSRNMCSGPPSMRGRPAARFAPDAAYGDPTPNNGSPTFVAGVVTVNKTTPVAGAVTAPSALPK